MANLGKAAFDAASRNSDIITKITYNIKEFPKINGESNDLNRFLRALTKMNNGDSLLFDGVFDFGNQAFSITKEIQLQGKNIGSSVIKNGLINIKASNVTCKNFFVDAINYADGFKVNDVACENILIKNCKTNVKSHGYLFESYNGLVKNVVVDNCIAENGLHGFVNKASNVTFKNCRAKNITYLGFGCISDNIQGVDKIAQCENAIIENCKAFTCGAGFSTYIREKFNNTVSFKCKNININGMFIDGCNQAMSLGEETVPADYLAISDIENVNIANITITNSVFQYYGIFVNRILNVNVSNINCDSYTKFMNGTTNQVKAKFNQVPFIQTKVNSANISTGDVTLDIYNCKNYDVLISSNNTNKINTINHVDGDEITLMIRATTDATFTFGGFGSMFTVPTGVVPSVKFGECMVTKWMYNRWVSKFICTTYYISRSH